MLQGRNTQQTNAQGESCLRKINVSEVMHPMKNQRMDSRTLVPKVQCCLLLNVIINLPILAAKWSCKTLSVLVLQSGSNFLNLFTRKDVNKISDSSQIFILQFLLKRFCFYCLASFDQTPCREQSALASPETKGTQLTETEVISSHIFHPQIILSNDPYAELLDRV